jgi:hypothetical protein
MASRRLHVILAAIAALLLPLNARAQEPITQTAIREALRDVGSYVADVLVTHSGKGRADYDLMTGTWLEYEPHWHTGQQIFGLVEAWRITGEHRFLNRARRAGHWWIGTEFQTPHPLSGLVNAYHGDHIGALINFTTISDGTPGLFALSKATGDPRYADVATRSGAWLYANTKVPNTIPAGDGLFYNFIDPSAGAIVKDRSPTHPGVRQPTITQTARPNIEGFLFKDMCTHTGDKAWCDRFIAQAYAALKRQDVNGLWMQFEPNNPETGDVHPRFNIWNAEAMLEAYELTKDPAFLQGALKTGRFMARVQRPDGAIFYNLKSDGTFRRDSITGSATAFAAILWLRLRDFGVGDEFTSNIDRSARWVLTNRFPLDHPDRNLRGGVLETRVRVIDGKTRIAIRDIASAFSLRFLAMLHDDMGGADVNADPIYRRTNP